MLPSEHEFQWGAQLSCTKSVATSLGMEVDYCVSLGGKDNYDCSDVEYLNLGSTQAGTYHVTWAYPACRGTGAIFRPQAVNQAVNGVNYPDVVGNPQTVSCAA